MTLALLLVLASACSAPSVPELPASPASITGRITAVTRDGERTGSIRVESDPTQATGSPKAVVRITQGTAVLTSDAPRRAEDVNALRVGLLVRVWYAGPVRESYPEQADAATVVIDSTPGAR